MIAIDPATGREVWSWKGRGPMVASVLATGGAPRGTSLVVFALP